MTLSTLHRQRQFIISIPSTLDTTPIVTTVKSTLLSSGKFYDLCNKFGEIFHCSMPHILTTKYTLYKILVQFDYLICGFYIYEFLTHLHTH